MFYFFINEKLKIDFFLFYFSICSIFSFSFTNEKLKIDFFLFYFCLSFFFSMFYF